MSLDAAQPSPELVAVIRRWHDAVRTRDGPVLNNLLSASEHLRYQGTADNESWSGRLFRDGFLDHVHEIPDFDLEEHSIEAFQAGSVGWAHCTAMLSFASTGVSEIHRFTFVLLLEDGQWRIIQSHVSNPRSNLEKIGVEHAALNDLIAAARDGYQHNQREGMASVMFTDIVNSTRIADLLGDRVWAGIVQDHFATVRHIVESNGGRLVKSLGDGTMSTFISAHSALAAAMVMQRVNHDHAADPQLGVRIGIHSGDVIQTEDDFFGTVVNKAARLAASSSEGEIRISDATRTLVGSDTGFVFEDRRSGALRGLAGTHQSFRLSWREN